MRVINGASTPSILYPFELPEPLYRCAVVLDATTTTNVVVVPCIDRIVLCPFKVGTVRSVTPRVDIVPIPAEFIFLTVISGVPVNPCAFVAKVAEAARVAFDAVPVKSPVTFPTRFPEKDVAVITPDATTPPSELNPTPCSLAFGLPPTCSELAGFSVNIPTFPST